MDKDCPLKKEENIYNCIRVKVRDRGGDERYVLYDRARQLLYFNYITVEFAKEVGMEFVYENEGERE